VVTRLLSYPVELFIAANFVQDKPGGDAKKPKGKDLLDKSGEV